MVVGWALYALVSYPHRGWYSWLVGSLADAVYLFGFVMMTPQAPQPHVGVGVGDLSPATCNPPYLQPADLCIVQYAASL